MLIYLQSSSWFSMSPSGSQPLVGPCCCLHTNVDLPGRVGLPVSKLCTEIKEARNLKEGDILGINMMCKVKANLRCVVDLHDWSPTSMYVHILYSLQVSEVSIVLVVHAVPFDAPSFSNLALREQLCVNLQLSHSFSKRWKATKPQINPYCNSLKSFRKKKN